MITATTTHKIVTQLGTYWAWPMNMHGSDDYGWMAVKADSMDNGLHYEPKYTNFSNCQHIIIECKNEIHYNGNGQA